MESIARPRTFFFNHANAARERKGWVTAEGSVFLGVQREVEA